MAFLRKLKLSYFIHIFALLHALVALLCRWGDAGDELFLTILTIAMSLIICYKTQLSIEFTAAVIIVGNIIGYLMGNIGATLLELLFDTPMIVHALSTAITTEVLGWSIIAITKILRQNNIGGRDLALSSSYIRWLLLAAGGVFAIRLSLVAFFRTTIIENHDILHLTGEVLSNSVALIILVCINIIYVRYSGTWKSRFNKTTNNLIFIAFMLSATLIETLTVGLGIPFRINLSPEGNTISLLIISFITQITIYCIVYIINYAINARIEMQTQTEKAHMAQYRYQNLKRQVNPHFLFNSLNILDCLVCEEKTEQASIYIHKLAGLYRYMIKSGDEDLVQLRDEMEFINLYVDLLKVRFPEGFEVETDVKDEALARYVLPCSLQLLLENATKHNAVTPGNPLIINIKTEGNKLIVSNNLVPKITQSQSTGLGHKYIRQQYMDLSGKEVHIEKSENRYCVTLPLL